MTRSSKVLSLSLAVEDEVRRIDRRLGEAPVSGCGCRLDSGLSGDLPVVLVGLPLLS